ncbi:Trehalose utilization [Calycomorphotria hydatis]|uniref:Trehalose utilization n=2 Tax=Calycomorphotria hydatis TaxID=2528027 RepID=A0A517TB48_9PLAN|nr:Trehalose utilization [Calycomorphotria hydatis]
MGVSQRIAHQVFHGLVGIMLLIGMILFAAGSVSADEKVEPPHVVFVTGDEEYRSEESMPMLAKILKRDWGFRVTVCYSLAEDGTIDPHRLDSISGLEALDDADLLVLFTRYRDLPHAQFKQFLNYFDSGRPVVGFRTATHAFKFTDEKSPHLAWNGAKLRELLGQQWITHHGHFGDGKEFLTDVTLVEKETKHPVLRGVEPFKAYSWLYHVSGGGDTLAGDSLPLLNGHALKSNHAAKGKEKRYPLDQPVAWVKTYTGTTGETGRVFFTTLGHPFDFRDENMRRLSLNGILWALGMEAKIPEGGCPTDFVGKYEPNNSSSKDAHKEGLKPEEL